MAAVVAAEGVVKTYRRGPRRAARARRRVAARRRPARWSRSSGRSGTGKSTLLHLIGGLDRPEAGTIEVAGERVTGASERALSRLRRRRIGFVFQFFHLLPELTGEANVLLAGRVRGARARRGRARARADRPARAARRSPARCRTSSRGGEQQRFAIARALVNDPARAARRRADRQPRRRGRRRGAAAAARAAPTRAARS